MAVLRLLHSRAVQKRIREPPTGGFPFALTTWNDDESFEKRPPDSKIPRGFIWGVWGLLSE